MKVKVSLRYVEESKGFIALTRHFTSGFVVEQLLGQVDLESLREELPQEALRGLVEGRRVVIRDVGLASKILELFNRRPSESSFIELLLEPLE
ncbi:MAG: hypothetical protein DRJ68_03615 [Thermoprotei archaeon]|nr:MAG: hypothetical protein DRJ62_02095 [Thermoprotei archaeon]RLF21372.1 MAG: hypothetical protein DRJ68_03615 [Thermoprotei archaeon]